MRRLVVLLLVLVPVLPAQGISGEVVPSIVSPGQPVAITVTAIQAVNLPDPCVWQAIRVGSPAGPIVPLPFACILILTPLAPGQSRTGSFNVPAGFAPGTYFFQCGWYTPTGPSLNNSFFCFEVRPATSTAPVLSANGPARRGQALSMDLQAPLLPGVGYFAAASLTSDNPLALAPGGPSTCIDADFLYALSFPAALPGLFANFSGVTNASGNASGITVNIPNDPALTWYPLKVQVALLDPTSLLPPLSNGLSFTVQP